MTPQGLGSKMSRALRQEAVKKKTRRGLWIIWGSVLVLLALIVFGQMTKPETDADHCPLDGAFSAQVAVLIDPSDVLTAVQQKSSLPQVISVLQQVPERAEIRVYSVARVGRRGDADADLRLCVPPHPDSIGRIEGLWRNREFARREYREDFIVPLESRLDEMLGAPGDSVSPIVEAIQAASVNAFQPRNARILRRLILVSDMVQHSGDLSFFRQEPDFGRFGGDPAYGTLRVDMSGVQATILMLARRGRAGRLQAGGLKDFWEDYFLDSGAGTPRWNPVEG